MNETQAAHTKGPLEAQQSVVDYGLHGDWWIIDPVSGFVIGEAIRDIEQDVVAPAEANARLWADAPRLKEVNEALLAAATQALAMLRQQGRGNGRTASVLEEAIARAREVQP